MDFSSITVIIPCYIRSSTIKRVLDSVIDSARLASVRPSIIIIDDNSHSHETSSLVELCAYYPMVRVLHNAENMGSNKSRMIGLSCLQTDWFCFLDSDDFWSINFLAISRDLCKISGWSNVGFYRLGRHLSTYHAPCQEVDPGNALCQLLLAKNHFRTSCMTFSKRVLSSLCWHAHIPKYQDWILSLDLLKSGFYPSVCTKPLVYAGTTSSCRISTQISPRHSIISVFSQQTLNRYGYPPVLGSILMARALFTNDHDLYNYSLYFNPHSAVAYSLYAFSVIRQIFSLRHLPSHI